MVWAGSNCWFFEVVSFEFENEVFHIWKKGGPCCGLSECCSQHHLSSRDIGKWRGAKGVIGRVLVALLARVAHVVPGVGGATSVVCWTTSKVSWIPSWIQWTTSMVGGSTPVIAGSVSWVGWSPCRICRPIARVRKDKLPWMPWPKARQRLDLARVLGRCVRLWVCLRLWIRLPPQPQLRLLSSHVRLSSPSQQGLPCIRCAGCDRCHKKEQAGAF